MMESDPHTPVPPMLIAASAGGTGAARYELIGEREGSNPGGWYRHAETGNAWYCKRYPNPDNARIEALANAIYSRAGIPVPETGLLAAEDGLWIASKKVASGRHATKEEQISDRRFQAGFVADAYLANWDVVGEFFDNIIADDAAVLYRVDNGGCGPLRANGESKPYAADALIELDDMRDPRFHAGQVFGAIDEAAMTAQAKRLIAALDERFLHDTHQHVGLIGDVGSAMLEGLLGRRHALQNRFRL